MAWTAGASGNSNCRQAFTYDAYGNMSCSASPAEPQCLATTYNTNNNQINYITNNTVNTSYQYDPAGDLQTDGSNTYQWDAEAHLTAVYMNLNGSLVSMNTYNALGQRVEDMTPSSTTDEAYGAGGNLLLRYTGDSNSRSFIPFNGRLLAEYYCGGMIFDHPDEIGSATTATDCTGNLVNEKLYYPFGEFWTGYALPNLGLHQEFAQLPDYDPETDQYNTANRHYSPSGRWLSPDPGGVKVVKLDDPQTWNMYAYVRNNPTTLTDPSGLGPNCKDHPQVCAGIRDAIASGVSAGQAIRAASQGAQNLATYIPDFFRTYNKEILSNIPFSGVKAPSAKSGVEKVAVAAGFVVMLTATAEDGGVASQIHHIATDKSIVSGFTDAFEKLFAKAGMSLQDEENLVELEGHAGRHSNEYHQYVLDTLNDATKGLSGPAFRGALVDALRQLRNELLANPEMVRGNFQ